MKIAYVGNFTQPHCTEVHLAATLEDLGHTVTRIQENGTQQSELIDKCRGHDLFLFTRTWGTLVTLDHLRQLDELGIPTASYHLDLYVGLKREDGLDKDPFWRTKYVFTPDGDPHSAEVFKAKGINHHYLKPGVFKSECNDGMFRPELAHDVVFVGGGIEYAHPEWPYRRELVQWLMNTYAGRFGKYGHPQRTMRNRDLNNLYASSKVVIGDSVCLNFEHTYYWSDRVYETIGRGGFMIHPFIEGMQEEFKDGETIVFYEFGNFDQLREKIDYYIEHDDEREKIRKAGHEFVKEHATYHNRLEQMIQTVMPTHPPVERIHGYPWKINLGAGADPTEGYVNVDLVDLPGIDVVHNLMDFPYPFDDESATNIRAVDVLEHLDNYTADRRPAVIAFIEECHRILKPGGEVYLQTPGYDAEFLWIDPTHVRGFHPDTMTFFDPDTHYGKTTGFYSKAKFTVRTEQLENKNIRWWMTKR